MGSIGTKEMLAQYLIVKLCSILEGQKLKMYFCDSRTQAITDIEKKSSENVDHQFVFKTDNAKIVPRNCSNFTSTYMYPHANILLYMYS